MAQDQVETAAVTGEQIAPTEATPAPSHWSGTLDAVHRASDALRAGLERTRALEAELKQAREEAAEEIAALRAHVTSLQEQLENMDERRVHAEDWLRRLHDAVLERLTPNDMGREEISRKTG